MAAIAFALLGCDSINEPGAVIAIAQQSAQSDDLGFGVRHSPAPTEDGELSRLLVTYQLFTARLLRSPGLRYRLLGGPAGEPGCRSCSVI